MPRSLWAAPVRPRSLARRMGRSTDPANHQSWPGTVACLYFRAQTQDDRSGYNVRQAPATWSAYGMSVPSISVIFDGCNYRSVAAIPSLRSANTDFPLHTPGSDWRDHGKCDCWEKAERNGSVPFGPKPHQPYSGSFAQKAERTCCSGTPVGRR